MTEACRVITSILLHSGDVLLSPKIPKRKNEGVECKGFKEYKRIKTSLRKRTDRPVGEARYADGNILKRR